MQCRAWLGEAPRGSERQVTPVVIRNGDGGLFSVWFGMAGWGRDGLGAEQQGKVTPAVIRNDDGGLLSAWFGRARTGQAMRGKAWHGMSRQGYSRRYQK